MRHIHKYLGRSTFGLSTLLLVSMLPGCIIIDDDDDDDFVVVLGAPYESCTFTEDCDTRSEACWEIATETRIDAMCSSTCTGDFDCFGDGTCLNILGSGVFLCYDRCFFDSDCEIGFFCTSTSNGDAICLP
ncbi:MAG: hypothetical protein AAF355_00085 [Myxococcota bacterium]